MNGPKLGSQEVVIDNLPGFPDNIHVGLNGYYWIGLTAPRSEVLDNLSNQPFLRKVIQRLPAFMRPNVAPYGVVIAIDGQGNVIENLQDPSGQVYASTRANESEEYLYVSSLTADFIARYKRSQFDRIELQNVSE